MTDKPNLATTLTPATAKTRQWIPVVREPARDAAR